MVAVPINPDGWRHAYQYDAQDNRTQKSTYLASQIQMFALDFTTFPADKISPVAGAWAATGGKLTATGTGEARAELTLPANLGRYEVKVQPAADGVSAQTEATAGLYVGETTDGSYRVEVRAFLGVRADNSPVVQRTLRLQRVSAGAVVTVAETTPMDYSGGELTLSVELLFGDTLYAAVEEDEGVSSFSVWAEAGTAGKLGLLTRDTTAAQTAAASFDDLKYWTVTGAEEKREYAYGLLNELLDVKRNHQVEEEYAYDDRKQPAWRKQYNTSGQVETYTTYEHDRLGRLTNVSQTSPSAQTTNAYTYYGASWMRATATVTPASLPAVSTQYFYDGFACIAQETGNTRTDYGVWNGQPLWETTGTQTLTYGQDGFGNVTGLWNGASFEKRFKYDAFGQVKEFDHNWQPITLKSSGPRYRGQLYDAGTDQVYLRNRYYSPGTGRFNTPDPIGYSGGLNLYGYCAGDPVNRTDMMGKKWKSAGGDVYFWEQEDGEPEVPYTLNNGKVVWDPIAQSQLPDGEFNCVEAQKDLLDMVKGDKLYVIFKDTNNFNKWSDEQNNILMGWDKGTLERLKVEVAQARAKQANPFVRTLHWRGAVIDEKRFATETEADEWAKTRGAEIERIFREKQLWAEFRAQMGGLKSAVDHPVGTFFEMARPSTVVLLTIATVNPDVSPEYLDKQSNSWAAKGFDVGAGIFAGGALLGGSNSGSTIVGQTSRVLTRNGKTLQKMFGKHGADFGLKGNWNPSRATDISRAIHIHINDAAVKIIKGTYRGEDVVHYVNPNTGLNVFSNLSGELLGVWKLGAEQLKSVLKTGRLF
jgi:RHS repeat-associated protein